MTIVNIHSILLFLPIFFPHRLRHSFRRRPSFQTVFKATINTFEEKTIKNPQYKVQDPNDICGNNERIT
nr:matrix protein M3 - influenza A virus (strain A/FPV/ Weybridge [H7N7], remantadine-resistant) [Influenza A virus]